MHACLDLVLRQVAVWHHRAGYAAAAVAAGVALHPLAAHAADTCTSVTTEVGSGDPTVLAQHLENESLKGSGGLRPAWLAATVLRCSLPTVADQAPRCLRAAQAKSLYDKFVEDSDGIKALKRERSDAQKSARLLSGDHGETCAALALQQAKASQHDMAARLFEAVFVLTYRPLPLFNAARASELGAKWAEAEVYYTAYLALPIPWRDRREAVAKLIEIQRRLAADAGDMVQRAQQTASDARVAAQRAEGQAANALQQASFAVGQAHKAIGQSQQAFARAEGAETRANQGQQQSQQAVQSAQSAEQRALQAEQRAAQSEQRAAKAESLLKTAQQQADAAVQQARAAEARANEAIQHAAAAQARLADLERWLRTQQRP
jgi:hypothetical protein